MNLKSTQRAGMNELAIHLISDENESVRVVRSRGVVSESILGALQEFQAIANASNCKKHMFHVSASPHPDEVMTEKQWQILWRQHEKINGLENALYIEVEHVKHGRTHRHRVYERVNSDTGKAINLSWTRLKNERLSRMVEVSFGHKIIQGKFNRSVIKHLYKDGYKKIAQQLVAAGIAESDQRVTQITHSENQQIKNGFDLKAARTLIADCWVISDNALSFKAALNEVGFQLADGDKAGVPVVIDTEGHVVPLLRAINAHRKAGGLSSVKKKDFMKKIHYPLSDVDAVKEKTSDTDIIQTLKQQVKINRNNSINKHSLKQKDNKTEINSIASSKQRNKNKLLTEYYGQKIQNTKLLLYWKIDRLGDGSLQLKNRTGIVIDHGDRIVVNTPDNQTHAVSAALQLVAIKGWDEITITGDDAFKKIAYKLCIESGIGIEINNPHDHDVFNQIHDDISKPYLNDEEYTGSSNTYNNYPKM
jgi:hypothetical protein